MARRCELTGKNALVGNKVSHANNKTKTRFMPNLCDVSLMSDAMGLTYRLRISAIALKSVEHVGGLDAFLHEGRQRQALGKGAAPQALDRQEARGRQGRRLIFRSGPEFESRSNRGGFCFMGQRMSDVPRHRRRAPRPA